jgi:toluene monooxygenase electron transfer component
MSNLENEQGEWEFIIRRVPGGKATSALFDLAPGGTVALDGPYGHAYLRPRSERNVICIAGGSGLSPLISIARGLDQVGGREACELDFFYGGRSADDICGEPLLRALPRLGPRLRFHAVVSGEDSRWRGPTGMVHELVAGMPPDALARADFYLAGPPAMAEAAVRMLTRDKAVPPEHIYYDRFF